MSTIPMAVLIEVSTALALARGTSSSDESAVHDVFCKQAYVLGKLLHCLEAMDAVEVVK